MSFLIWVLNIGLIYAQDKNTIKVMSFNIHYGTLTNGDFDIKKAAEVIKAESPDLVMLQEVDDKTRRSLGKDLTTELALASKMSPVFGKSIDYQGGWYGNAILTKYSVVKSQVHLLPFFEGTEQRTFLEVLVKLNHKKTIRVISTHLAARDSVLRLKQSKYINSFFKDEIPTLLAGDLNAVPDSEEIKLLNKKWQLSFDKTDYTFPSDIPIKKIDYILYSPIKKWKVLKSKVIRDDKTSDHLPIVTVFELLKGCNK